MTKTLVIAMRHVYMQQGEHNS